MHAKSGLIRGVVSLQGDNLVVFSYLSSSDICHYKRGGLLWAWPYKTGDYCIYYMTHVATVQKATYRDLSL